MTSPRQQSEPKPAPTWTLGDRLRKVRRACGLGQAELAAQLGENRKTYAAWELDVSSPRNVVAVARRIELLTGYPATWVLGLDDAPAATPNGAATAAEDDAASYRSNSA